MADNFLEKRQEAYRIQIAGKVQHKVGADIKQLLLKCAANVQYNGSYVVRDDQLNGLQAAACVTIQSNEGDASIVFVRLGMVLQAMMLRAAEMGLHAEIVECGACDGRASAVLAVGRPDCR